MLARLTQRSLLLIALVGCGVSPRPERADVSTLPQRQLDAEETKELAVLVERAIAAVSVLDYEVAEAAAEEALAIDPRSARARAVLAIVTLKAATATEPSDAQAMLGGELQMRLAKLLSPDDPFVGWMHAVFLAESGHLSAAAAAAEEALPRSVDAPAAARLALLRIAGSYRYELGEERAAVPHLQEYVRLRPDDPVARYHLGGALLRLAVAPQGGTRASVLVAQRQAEEAARAFTRCLELMPADAEVAAAVVTAHLRAADLASERLGQIPDSPDRIEEQNRLVAERDGNRQAADAALRQALERFPEAASVQFQAGVVAEAAADGALARSCYERAITMDPGHVPSLLNLADLLVRSGERSAAAGLLRQALDAPASRRELTSTERKRIEDWLRSS